jgi:Domain of unknown function (DUF4386)
MLVGLVFFSLGAATHSYVLWKSCFIPRALSVCYLLVTRAVLISCSAIIIISSLDAIIDSCLVLPAFVVERVGGLWLSIRGANIQPLGPVLTTGART